MKYAVLIFGLLGALSGGALGAKWIYEMRGEDEAIKKWEAREQNSGGNTQSARMRKKLEDFLAASYLMIGGAVMGFVGAVLVFSGKLHPLAGGVLMILASVMAGFMEPRGLLATAPTIFGAALCFMMKRPTRKAVAVPT